MPALARSFQSLCEGSRRAGQAIGHDGADNATAQSEESLSTAHFLPRCVFGPDETVGRRSAVGPAARRQTTAIRRNLIDNHLCGLTDRYGFLSARLIVLAVAVVALFDCEKRLSSNPLPLAPEGFAPASSSNAIDALFAPSLADAGPVPVDSSHALTLMICTSSLQGCPAEADASSAASYRVVFGSGRGAIRSRGQAIADLYQVVRDRTTSGERLTAESRVPGDAGASVGGRSTTKASAGGSDPIAQCALRLFDLVDGGNEVTVDVIHGGRSNGCMVSLGPFAADGGAPQCLIEEPERLHRPGRGSGRGGIQF